MNKKLEGDKFVPPCDELPHTCQQGAPNSLVPYSDGPCEKCAAMNLEYWKSRAETAELKLLTFHEEITKLAERDTRERIAQTNKEILGELALGIRAVSATFDVEPEDQMEQLAFGVKKLRAVAERIRGKV